MTEEEKKHQEIEQRIEQQKHLDRYTAVQWFIIGASIASLIWASVLAILEAAR